MVLVHDHVPKSVRFDEQGYRGVIVPVAVMAALRCSLAETTPTSPPSSASPRGCRTPSSGPADGALSPRSDADFAEQVDQAPGARRQGRMIGLELHRDASSRSDSDSAGRTRRRRIRRSGRGYPASADPAIPWILDRPAGIGRFRMQLAEKIAEEFLSIV